jgi:hypothetical protein
VARSQKADLKTIEPYDVSFAKIGSDDNWAETVQKVATAINVQFTESSSKHLPFVPFKEFQNLLREEKVFLFGPSGCGKSRTIIELLRSKNAGYDRIFVINPSNPAGLDSGREGISTLSQQFGRNDLVIWDNFPEGLVKRDLENAFGALEIVNSRSVQNLFIALKPTYLEMYRGLTIGIPDIYTHEITCDLETMKALIKAYGREVEQYKDVFEKYVSTNTDKIARVLWQKQPLSLTVVDYYKALVDKTEKSQASFDSSKALLMAQEWLPVYDYFERQFEVMKNIPVRNQDVDFLYTLRFCYEAGFDRTHSSIAALQKGIFGSTTPQEPTRKMGTWIYLSGQNYAMHDSAKNAIRLMDYSRMKIISYLIDHFLDIFPKGKGELHSLGLFLGKNIEFIPNDAGRRIIPDQLDEFMKKNAVFERAFGRGIGENFELLDEVLQMLILEHVDTHTEFGVGLADSFGERFMELDESNRKRVLKKIYHGMLFARYFGQSVGRLYGRLSNELRSIVMSHAEKNPQFADGLGMGLGYIYATLESTLQYEIMHKAQRSFEISRGLGFGFGLTFALLQEEEDAKKTVAIADKNSELDVGFGMGLAVSYSNLPDELRKLVLDRAARDCEFAFGAGIYGAYFYKEACPKDLFMLLHSNGEVSYGLGVGFGAIYFYLPEQFQLELEPLLKTNVKLDDGLGIGIGFVLKHLPLEVQEKFISKASANNAFATGLGYGLGFTWHYIGETLRQRALAFANSNNDFARGLGIGLGSHLDYLKPTFFDQVISFADTNSEFDRGFGVGAAWASPYHSDDAKHTMIERMKTRGEFARGVGFGLARVVRHFSTSEREKMLDRLAWDSMFSEGFGEGTAQFLWTIYDEANKHQFLELATNSPELSKGFGIGLGFLYSYFKNELGQESYKRLFKIDPNLRRGLGTGMGRAYRYLSEDACREAMRMSEEDVQFAIGFGEGIGTVYNYLEDSQKELVMSYIDGEDAGFSRGLGMGFGSVFPYFEDDLRKKVLAHIVHNEQLSLGLGEGLAIHISYYQSEPLVLRIFELARNNSLLAMGLGKGCGVVFPYLSQATKDWLSSQVSIIDGFAFGFGIGIGKIRRYLDSSIFEQAATFTKSNKFMEGFALGLGSVTANLSEDLLLEVLSTVAARDASFAKNFGFGLGHVFSLLDDVKRKAVLETMRDRGGGEEEEEGFLAGLGEGLGHYVPSTGSRLVEELMHITGSVNLAIGAARGVTESFTYLNLAEVLGMLEYASLNPKYGEVLGEGLAEKFASLDEEKQSLILDALQKDSAFSRAFAKIIPKNLMYMSSQTRERISGLAAKFPHLEITLEERYE